MSHKCDVCLVEQEVFPIYNKQEVCLTNDKVCHAKQEVNLTNHEVCLFKQEVCSTNHEVCLNKQEVSPTNHKVCLENKKYIQQIMKFVCFTYLMFCITLSS